MCVLQSACKRRRDACWRDAGGHAKSAGEATEDRPMPREGFLFCYATCISVLTSDGALSASLCCRCARSNASLRRNTSDQSLALTAAEMACCVCSGSCSFFEPAFCCGKVADKEARLREIKKKRDDNERQRVRKLTRVLRRTSSQPAGTFPRLLRVPLTCSPSPRCTSSRTTPTSHLRAG